MNTTSEDSIADLLSLLTSIVGTERPLAAFDIESTGVNPDNDRIVEVTIGRVEPQGTPIVFRSLVNPGCPIPKNASDIHGITDADVIDAPWFADVGARVWALLKGADLIGYNHRRFDVKIVAAECARVGLKDPCAGARLVDVCRIFHAREPRDLTGAMDFYLNADHAGAHGTTADVAATLRVLLAQFERYADLPKNIDQLDALNREPNWIDAEGKLAWLNGEPSLNFGKHKGASLRRVERSYLQWMTAQDWCPKDTKAVVLAALKGKYPAQPELPVGVEA
jgi:DNA polymerase-3 subunit epsilon